MAQGGNGVMMVFVMKVKTHSDKREEFLQTIRLLGGGLPIEKGCLSHDWYQAMKDSNSFILFERWVNGDAMKEQHRSEQFRVLLGAVRTLGELVDIHCFRLPEGGERVSVHPTTLESLDCN
jgi:quinol monooxygenase YgiN